MRQEASFSRFQPAAYPGTDLHPDLLPPGTVVGGFRLLRHVATGSFGSVWQVESVECPGRHFALKFSLYRPGEGSVGDARAVREVQLLLRAAHENTVRVVAHGRWRDPEKGLHYVVLQWVEGGTLWQWAHTVRPSARQVVKLIQRLARALQRAHEAGVLHRDIKPDNVLVRAADGEPFLSDFGVGDAEGAHTLTRGAGPPGTLPFQSPQMLASHLPGSSPYQAQPADDWYALGVLLYQLLAEVRPYPDSDQAPVLAQWVARYKPVAPHELNPRVPPALGQVALKLMSAEPHLRYPDGQALCAALEQALATVAELDAPLLPPAPPPDKVPTRPPSESDGPLAQDEQVRNTHVFKDEQDPEDERLEQVELQRDTLLKTRRQRRPPLPWRRAARVARQPWARAVAAAVLLGGLALGAWALGYRPPASLSDPQAPPPMAALPASSHLAPLDASPPKEGSPVKTPQSPHASTPTPPAEPPGATLGSTTRAALCAVGLAAAGCASVPVRPTQQECPPEANAVMEQRKWRKIDVMLDPNHAAPTDHSVEVTLRPGPIISKSTGGFSLDEGLIYGDVFFAEDGRTVVRYTSIQLEGGARVPICFAIVAASGFDVIFDVSRVLRRTEGSVTAINAQVADRVRVLPD